MRNETTQEMISHNVVLFGRIGLGIGLLFSVVQASCAYRWNLTLFWQVFPLTAALVLCASFKLSQVLQVQLGLLVLGVIAPLYLVETYVARSEIPAGTAALKAGRSYDPLGPYEKIEEFRAQGIEAYPAMPPHELYSFLHRGLSIEGREVLPLSGIADSITVFCNESGTYSIYRSDEHGFNNRHGIWSAGPLDIAVLGDSFAQGACVPQDRNAVAGILQRYPATLNLGMAGNGPLFELATLKEYLPPLRPRIVLWLFYENDLSDLEEEATSPLLIRYLDRDFRQNLNAQQEAIERSLKQLVAQRAQTARRWPHWLSFFGLNHRVAPLSLQDFVLDEDLTSISGIIRLRNIHRFLNNLAARWSSQEDSEVTGLLDSRTSRAQALLPRVLSEAQATVKAWGGKLYFVYIPSYGLLKYRGKLPVYRFALETASSQGLPIIDLYPVFQAQPEPLALFPFP
jgi:hypothetical protein